MADEKYRIIYEVDSSRAIRGIDEIEKHLVKLQGTITKSAQMLKAIGQNTPGLTAALGQFKRLDVELKAQPSLAKAAEDALKRVGAGNSSIGSMTTRLGVLEAELKKVAAAAATATAAAAGLGQGGGGFVGVTPGGGAGGPPAKGKAGVGGLGVTGMAAAAGIGLAITGIRKAGEGAQQGRDYYTDATAKVAELREQAREYASLRKRPGPNDEILREIAGFARQTGATPEDAVKFLTTYEGSATTGRDKGNIGGKVGQGGYTQAQQEALEAKLKVVGGQFAMRTGLDSKTAGDLTAVVSTYRKINSESDLAGQLAGAHYGLDQGRGEISPLARSELGQAGAAIEAGRVSGLPELGAFVGVASVVSKSAGGSGTTYGQVSRFLNESGEGNDDQKAFIEESGIGAAKGDFAKLKALRDYLAKVKPEDANTFLESKGYGNSTDRRSALGMVGQVDVLEERIARAKAVAGDGTAELRRLAENQGEIATAGARAKAGEFAIDVEAGIQNEKLENGRTAAMGRLKDPNQPGGPRINTPYSSLWDAVWTPLMAFSSTGQQERIDQEAIEQLTREGKKHGIDVAAKYPGLMKTGLMRDSSSDTLRREQFSKAYDEIKAAGGDPLGLGGSVPLGRPPGGGVAAAGGMSGASASAGAAGGSPGGAAAVVAATQAVGEKIDRQTQVLAEAIQGGRSVPPAPVRPPAGDGGGFNPGRR